jgi:hypothetical protein
VAAPARMVHAGLNGEIMSKSNDVSTLDHRPLADSELNAVSGGFFADYVKQLLANSEPIRRTGRDLTSNASLGGF